MTPHIEGPDDWPTEFRLGPVGLYPTSCGDHAPGFVGLYAIINALALLLAETSPLKPSEERMLLDVGWNFLLGRAVVAPWHGIRSGNLERLAEGLTFALSRRRHDWVRCERLRLGDELARPPITFERLLVAKRAVIVLLGGGHYTVLRGYTPRSWLLFDAMGRMCVRRTGGRRFGGAGCRQPTPFALALSRLV